MELKTRNVGGSIAIIIPKKISEKLKIEPDETVNVEINKIADLSFLWGTAGKWSRETPTQKIMDEIDEGEEW